MGAEEGGDPSGQVSARQLVTLQPKTKTSLTMSKGRPQLMRRAAYPYHRNKGKILGDSSIENVARCRLRN